MTVWLSVFSPQGALCGWPTTTRDSNSIWQPLTSTASRQQCLRMIFTLPSVGLRSRYSFTTVTTRCFRRMANKAGIEHRYSCLAPGVHPENAAVDAEGFCARGYFPDTGARMRRFEQYAPGLAQAAVERLQLDTERDHITHLLITCCTGFPPLASISK